VIGGWMNGWHSANSIVGNAASPRWLVMLVVAAKKKKKEKSP